MTPVLEQASLWLAVMALAAAGSIAMLALASAGGAPHPVRVDRALARLLGVALALLTAGIAARWQRVGHGPFLSMYEVLASSVWSLGLVFAFACRRRGSLT